VNFNNLTLARIYYDTLQNINSCDSVIEFTLSFYHFIPITQYAKDICEGETYTDDNFEDLSLEDTYYITLQNINGCDSIVELTLTVNQTYFTQITDSIYIGNSYDFFGRQLTENGIYYDTLQTIHGCDSIFELTLNIFGVGIVETHCNASLRIYPNPAKNELKIMNYELREGMVIEIYNVVGQKLLSIKSLQSQETTIDVKSLAKGMYFLKIGNKVARFVKE